MFLPVIKFSHFFKSHHIVTLAFLRRGTKDMGIIQQNKGKNKADDITEIWEG